MKYPVYLCLFLVLFSVKAYALPSAKVTLKVVDEAGVPIEGAKAVVNFAVAVDGTTESEITDSDGLATLSAGSSRFVEYGAVKDGYYISWYQKNYQNVTGFRRWQPWNETLVVELKKIKEPRALYVGNHRGSKGGKSLKIPGLNQEYGYDLIARDWVVPHGSGLHRDFIFKIVNNNEGKTVEERAYDYSFLMTFNNDGDGIQKYDVPPVYGSKLLLPHEAHESGYKNKLKQRKARSRNSYTHNDFPKDRNYFFRVRTKRDDKGNIESALYGKIYGNITFSRNNIGMLYYLNPDENDRNLEADYKKNLFPRKRRQSNIEYPP